MALEDFLPERLIYRRKREEEYEEIPVEEVTELQEKINVRIEKLGGTADVDRIVKYVKRGFIVFLKTKELQKRQFVQFQSSVLKLKRLSKNYGFDLVGTEDGYLILAPKFVTIERE